MKTDELIEALALDAGPSRAVSPRLMAAAALGALGAFGLVVLWLGFRPDLAEAPGTRMFWMKAAYTALLALGGFWSVERLSRPVGSSRRGLVLALSVFALLAAAGLWQFMAAQPVERMPILMGESWRRCPRNILVLGMPVLAATLLVVRGLAPTRLTLAGAAAGLFAGGVAATVYGLHCPENTMTFVAVWYSLGVAAVTATGALLGRWALRWR
ncbi:MAG TPA: DUF1109 domain-containing protein [Phenylobacterium sp.]|nr:DUF1109 domain-containing protein [Phenylobacterium sp.]